MYKNLIIEYVPTALFIVIAICATVKLYSIGKLKHKEGYADLLLRSFFPYSKQAIKNTTHNSLKQYYRSNNKMNTYFYAICGTMLFLYFAMYIIK